MATKTNKTPGDAWRAAIREAMTAQDHDLTATAQGAGMHRNTLGRWLAGTREMTTGQLAAVMTYLGITETAWAKPKTKKGG